MLSLVGGRAGEAELGERVLFLLYALLALLGHHRLGHVLHHEARVKVAHIVDRLYRWLERRLDLLRQQRLLVHIAKEWMSQYLVHVVLCPQPLLSVFLQELKAFILVIGIP